jgi:hypothetical protein
MLNTHDPEMRVIVSGGKNGAISRGRSDVVALGARIRRVDKRLAAKDYTIGVHKFLSHWLKMQICGNPMVTKVPSMTQ